MLTQIIGYFLAAAIGLSLGLIGGGGSVLALPILVYVMGIEPKPAIAMTLVIVGTVSLVGVVPHWQQGNLNLKKALIFGSSTMVGAFLGAKLAGLPGITGAVQMLLFAVMMLLAAFLMIRRTNAVKEDSLSAYPEPVCKYCWLWMLTEGIGIGILTGLVGVGGGFALVPALVLLGKTPMKQAIGTSLIIISLNSLAGFLGYLGTVNLDWKITVSFTFIASVGTLAGAYLSRYVSAKRLQKSFGYFLIAVAGFILLNQFNASKVTPVEGKNSQTSCTSCR